MGELVMMKLRAMLTVLAASFVLLGCSSRRELAPPSWIIGTWSDSSGNNTWEFTQNDAIHTLVSPAYDPSGTTDYVDLAKVTFTAQLSDFATDTSYTFTLVVFKLSFTYSFVATSSITMDYTDGSLSLALIRQ
jgi:hypothetical protein